jgi:hypothetical protein
MRVEHVTVVIVALDPPDEVVMCALMRFVYENVHRCSLTRKFLTRVYFMQIIYARLD